MSLRRVARVIAMMSSMKRKVKVEAFPFFEHGLNGYDYAKT